MNNLQVEYNVEYARTKGNSVSLPKWDSLHRVFDSLKAASIEQNTGWARVKMASKTEAKQAQVNIADYVRRIGAKGTVQTSVIQLNEGYYLMLRKLKQPAE